MSFRNKLQFFLVRRLQISNREAQRLLFEKKIRVNGSICSANLEILPEDEICYENEVLQVSKSFKYIAFYKPKGIETTLNKAIPDNLIDILPFDDIFPIGRLDKASEGLLLLSDDGRLYDKVLRNEHKMEKEYIVKVDKPIDEDFLFKMSSGIKIMGKTTLPCKIEAISPDSFKIVLIQGLNRQIRRMCYKLGYEVVFLCRIRIGNISIGNLKEGEWENVAVRNLIKNH